MRQVLERTQNVDYRIPTNPRISPACRDFLSSLLVADPDHRLSTAAIMEHPWFCQGLPAGVKSLNDECLRLKVRPAAAPHLPPFGRGLRLRSGIHKKGARVLVCPSSLRAVCGC